MAQTYRLQHLMASGGMAEVYLGTATGAEGFERTVAVKRMLPHIARNERFAKMFATEAKLASFLHHQNIVQVLDVGRAGDEIYLVMELVDGWDLGVLIGQVRRLTKPFPPHLAAYIGLMVNTALCHAYRHVLGGRQVIAAHRDVSPSNILVSAEGEVKVADFGIARIDAGEAGTEPGAFKGKYSYSAPEVLSGEKATHLSDQFSLGIVLHEMLSGSHPWGEQRDPMAYVQLIATQPAPRLAGVSAELRDAVEKALSKPAQQRFATPEEMGQALAQFLARAGEPATSLDLAAFVKTLEPPPLPTQRYSRDTVSSLAPGTLDLLPVSTPAGQLFSLAPSTADRPPTEGSFRPSGPALDPTGRLVDKPAPAPEMQRQVSGVREIQIAPIAEPDERSLELDLDERFVAPPAPVQPAPVRPRRTFPVRLVLGLVVAVGLVVAAWLAWPLISPLLPATVGRRASAAVVSFDSEPSGARVIVAGEMLGVTPLAIDNDYPDALINVRIERAGYRSWTGKFQGGKRITVHAVLQR